MLGSFSSFYLVQDPPAHEMIAPIVKVVSYRNWANLDRLSQVMSWVILDSVKLTVIINHHTETVWQNKPLFPINFLSICFGNNKTD